MSGKIASFYAEMGLKKDKFDKGMNEAGQATGKLNSQFTGMATAVKAAMAVVGISILAVGRQAMAAYDQQAKAEAALLLAVKNRESVQKALIAQASELQGKTLFGDEVTIDAQKQLAVLGLTSRQIKELIPLIQDFATSQGMDLVSAAQLVGKAVATSTNALGRYGVELDSTMSMAEKASEIQKIFNERYGGQAAAAAEAGTGSLKQLSNSFGDLLEVLGKVLATNSSGFFKSLTNEVLNLTNILNADHIPAWEKFFSMLDPGTKQMVAFKNAAYLAATAGQREQQEQLDNAVDILAQKRLELQNMKDLLAETIKQREALQEEQRIKNLEKINAALEKQKEIEAALWTNQPTVAQYDYGLGVTMQPKGFDLPSMNLGQQVFGGDEFTPQGFDYEQLAEAAAATQQFIDDMNGAMSQFVSDFVGTFAEGIGQLMSGNMGMNQFFSGILDMFGGFMVKMGKMLIAYGVSMVAFKKALSNPVGAIIAGVALTVIGGLISGLAQKGPSVAGSSAGMGGSVGGGYGGGGYGGVKNQGNMVLTAEVSGNSLKFVLDRANKNYQRVGG